MFSQKSQNENQLYQHRNHLSIREECWKSRSIDARSYEMAYQMAVQLIIDAAAKFYFLLDSEKLNTHDKAEYGDLLSKTMNEALFCSSLKKLSVMLEKHYGEKVILLIDEYDVPLAKAFEHE